MSLQTRSLPPIGQTASARLRVLVVLLASLSLGACGGGDAATEGGAAGTGGSVTTAAPAAGGGDDADLSDITNYRLTMDRIDRYYAAQRNMIARLQRASPQEREAMGQSMDMSGNASLDEMVRNFERQPAMSAALREAGLSAREYALTTMALVQSGMAAAMMQARPNDNQDSLARAMKANPENIRFIRQHQAELAQKQKALEAGMKGLETGNDPEEDTEDGG